MQGHTRGEIPDHQAAAWLMAAHVRGLSRAETAHLTDAMLRSGEMLDLISLGAKAVDKHSTGGVGDKTSLILAPLVAAGGLAVPMISGRGLGHTGGTLDKLEAIPGFRVNLSIAEFTRVLEQCGCAMIGQTAEIAPADRKLYQLRHFTSTIDSPPLICASIMSKKLAEGIDALVLDVKTGSGAFMKREEDAALLGELMVDTAKRMGVRAVALITDMDQPLGRKIGNALEVEEVLDVLRGGGPADLARPDHDARGVDVPPGRANRDGGRGRTTGAGADRVGRGAREVSPHDRAAGRRRESSGRSPAHATSKISRRDRERRLPDTSARWSASRSDTPAYSSAAAANTSTTWWITPWDSCCTRKSAIRCRRESRCAPCSTTPKSAWSAVREMLTSSFIITPDPPADRGGIVRRVIRDS